MERVATSMQSQAMLTELLRAQRTMLDAQQQVATGKRINEFADDPASLGGLMAARAADTQAADYEAGAKAVRQRLDLQDTQIDALAGIAGDLRQTILDSVANNSGAALNAELEGTMGRIASILNAQVDGQYIYGGTRQDVPPVTVSTVADLAALPATADAFQNNQIAQSAKIDQNQSIQFGQLASDLGGPLLDLLRQIAAFNSGPSGPFGGDLTQAQADFLTSLAPTAATVADGVNDKLAVNGVAFRQADDAVARHGETRTTLAGMISDIEDVDMASAIEKLNLSQLALEASAKTFQTVQGLSLLDFLQ